MIDNIPEINGVLIAIGNSPYPLPAVILAITLYALLGLFQLHKACRRVNTNLNELQERLSNSNELYKEADEISQNEFIKAWNTLLLHQKKPKDRDAVKDQYLERHPSFYINADLLKKADFSLKKFHRTKQNIYLIAIFFTFAGILLALALMVPAFNSGDPSVFTTAVPQFLKSVSVKFLASLVGIFWMLVYGWRLGKAEDHFDKEIANIQSNITTIFGGGFDLGFDVEMDKNAADLIKAVHELKSSTGHLTNAIQKIEETPINKNVAQIREEITKIEAHIHRFDPKTGEDISRGIGQITKHALVDQGTDV